MISLRNPYLARTPFFVRPPRRQDAAVRFPYEFKGLAASTILFRKKLYKFEKSEARRSYTGRRWHCTIPVRSSCGGLMLIAQKTHDFFDEHGGKKKPAQNGTAAAQSSRLLCATYARKLHGYRTISVGRLNGYCTIFILSPSSLSTDFARLLEGQ